MGEVSTRMTQYGTLLDSLKDGIGIASMVGVTDGAFCGKYGVGNTIVQIGGYGVDPYKEDLEAIEGFLRPEVELARKSGAKVAVNFLGFDEDYVLAFAEGFKRAGGDILEYNAHTPSPKYAEKGLGYALLKKENQSNLYRVTRRLAEEVPLPLMIKARVWTTKSSGASVERIADDYVEVAEKLKENGAVGLHLNIRNEARGEPDLAILKEIKGQSDLFLMASGYVRDAASARSIFEAGAEVVLIGQAAMDDPEIVGRIVRALEQ